MPNPLPPHRPVMPPHHQHPEHVDIKPDLPGFKPDVGLQEYMRYEMLRPQPLPPPPNTSISSEVHRHHHHHKHLPPPPKEEISQETQAAMNVMQNVQQPAEPTITQMRQRLSGDAAELFFTGLINLNDLSNTLKTNSKGAKAKLVLAMANASKHGIDNSQINDTLKMISASMAATETSTPSKVLKNIIELYLPWYPLQQGVGFDFYVYHGSDHYYFRGGSAGAAGGSSSVQRGEWEHDSGVSGGLADNSAGSRAGKHTAGGCHNFRGQCRRNGSDTSGGIGRSCPADFYNKGRC